MKAERTLARAFSSGMLALMAASAGLAQNPCTSTNTFATPYDSNNGLDGIMFDVTALQTITINCFEANFAAGICDPVIRHKSGTHVGFESLSGAWTAIDSVDNLTSAGADLPTYVPIDVNVTITAGNTEAFYISNRAGAAPNSKYTDGSLLGNVYASNTHLQVKEGTGINYPFGFHLSPRKFNGTLYYTVSTTGVQEIMNEERLTVAPNPVAGVLRLEGVEGAAIRVTDASGRQALEVPWIRTLDVTRLEAGVYVLSILDAHGVPVAVRNFVKE